MKKIFSVILAGLMLVGCQNFEEQDVVGVDGRSLTVSLAETRTSLGAKEGTTYPVYWSEGDCIVVNGVKSQAAQINVNNQASASFELGGVVEYPYSITYPYCENTSAEQAKVFFPDKQSYVEGTFAKDAAPMCGYVKSGNSVALNHLATVLRLPIRASESGIELSKVVVTAISGAKIAGEFAVDCATATITPCEGAKNSIIYTLPKNFALSTNEDRVLYIALPSGELGACAVEFFDSDGGAMVGKWSSNNLRAGVVREFKSITYEAGETCTLPLMGAVEDDLDLPYFSANGYVRDSSGKGIAGVPVSDGFSITTTDAAGFYSLSVSQDAWYIYISLPSEYEVPINENGQPCFYKRYTPPTLQYDFTLTPLAGGKEDKFALFVLGDPQVDNNTEVKLFKNDAVPGIKKHCDEVTSTGLPCYAITLGDILSSNKGDNDNYMRVPMRDAFAYSNIGLPVFQIMGNHDYTYFKEGDKIVDENSSNINLAAQRRHEEVFGPINYSFDRGNFHIVGMKNIYYTQLEADGVNSYGYGFTKEEYEWLRQDLALVPKDKAVVLCVHGRILGYTSRYYAEVKSLLNEFNEVHIMTGHTHKTYNYDHATQESSTPKIYEHNVGALCGAWWSSRICGDGVPNGYQVFIAGKDANGGGKFTDWYFIGFYEGMNTRDHQMRLYRGDAVTGIDKSLSGKPDSDITGYYGFNYGEDVLIANVYNADPKWVIKVYEDDVHTGNMELIPSVVPSFTSLIGDWTYENPRRFNSGDATSQDMYVVGLFAGVLGVGDSSEPDYCWNDYRSHLFKYKLTNPNNKANVEDIKIKVEATDRFGNVYTETKITEGTDYSTVKY